MSLFPKLSNISIFSNLFNYKSNKKKCSLYRKSADSFYPKEPEKGSFLHISQKGSLTLECAVVLPIFFYALLLFLYFFHVLTIQTLVEHTAAEALKEAGAYTYVSDAMQLNLKKDAKGKKLLQGAVSGGFSWAFVKGSLSKELSGNALCEKEIEGGINAIHCLAFDKKGNGSVDLLMQYKIRIPITFFGAKSVPVITHLRVHDWSGYTEASADPLKERFVFITPYGTVYHTRRECTYLKLSIRSVSMHQVEALRNEDGGKFYPCERCMAGKTMGTVYVCNYGNRFHASLQCSGLKRGIMQIPLSQIGDRKACSKCG